MALETVITRNLNNKQLHVTRSFNAPVNKVWRAWTEPELLDKWWAPRPWRTETKFMDFTPGGYWLYSMVGPEGERHWCRADYGNIDKEKSYSAKDAFCDENGTPAPDFPRMNLLNEFKGDGDATVVNVTITFDTEAELEKIVEMGFKEGFTMAHGNLDELLASEI